MTVVRRRWSIVGVVALLVAVLTGLVAATGEVPGWEESVFHAVNDLPDGLTSVIVIGQSMDHDLTRTAPSAMTGEAWGPSREPSWPR